MRYSKDPELDRTLHHSVRDGMAYAVMAGGSETYFSAFALFMRASAQQVAILATLPALLGTLVALLAPLLAQWVGRRKPVVIGAALLQGLILLPLLASIWLAGDHVFATLLLLFTLYFAGANLAAPLWTSWLGDLVPERRRGRFFGRRTRWTTITSFSALVAGGVILHVSEAWEQTAIGFALLLGIGCSARLISVYQLGRMQEPAHGSTLPRVPLGREWIRNVRQTGAFWFTAYFALMQASVGISAPFFSVYMLRDLNFTYLEFMMTTGTAVLVQFLTLTYWGRISDAFGNRLILVVTSLSVPLLPALWVVSDNFWYLIAIQCLSGLSWAGFSLSAGNLLFDLVPRSQRSGYVVMHSIVTAGGVFLGGLLGVALLNWLPARATLFGDPTLATSLLWIFLISTAARLTVALLFLRRVREVRKPRRAISPHDFVFRATRFNAFIGMVYEFVTLFRRKEQR
ncbi:MAG: MFS transporter [Proteobacteria bacterium]|nr:MAG: MFS transporter [Pseudomonadota bacterium]QKK10598.1 MAG: MFS transporter [Pseudomonadota bacterium]